MASVRIELNSDGIRSLLRSEEVRDLLKERGDAVAQAAQSHGITVGPTEGQTGDQSLPVDVASSIGSGRARATVMIDHPAGLAVEAKYRILVGSLTAAR